MKTNRSNERINSLLQRANLGLVLIGMLTLVTYPTARAYGNVDLKIQPVVDFDPPTVPRGVNLSVNGGIAHLRWEPARDDVTGLVGYRVYRDGVFLKEVGENFYQESVSASGSSYAYQVSGVDGAGNESALSTPTGLIPASAGIGEETFVYPNPAVGGEAPTIRTESESGDRVWVRMFDISGAQVGSGELHPQGLGPTGNTIYELKWTDAPSSGSYFGIVETHQQGSSAFSRVKFAVVR